MNFEITVIQGEDLVAKDRNLLGKLKSSDPYVEVTWGDNNEVGENSVLGRTQTVYKNLSPVWDASFSTKFNSLEDYYNRISNYPNITLSIYDCDIGSADDLMGVVHVPVPTQSDGVIMNNNDRSILQQHSPLWYTIPKHSAKRATGRIQVSFKTFIFANNEKEIEKDSTNNNNNATTTTNTAATNYDDDNASVDNSSIVEIQEGDDDEEEREISKKEEEEEKEENNDSDDTTNNEKEVNITVNNNVEVDEPKEENKAVISTSSQGEEEEDNTKKQNKKDNKKHKDKKHHKKKKDKDNSIITANSDNNDILLNTLEILKKLLSNVQHFKDLNEKQLQASLATYAELRRILPMVDTFFAKAEKSKQMALKWKNKTLLNKKSKNKKKENNNGSNKDDNNSSINDNKDKSDKKSKSTSSSKEKKKEKEKKKHHHHHDNSKHKKDNDDNDGTTKHSSSSSSNIDKKDDEKLLSNNTTSSKEAKQEKEKKNDKKVKEEKTKKNLIKESSKNKLLSKNKSSKEISNNKNKENIPTTTPSNKKVVIFDEAIEKKVEVAKSSTTNSNKKRVGFFNVPQEGVDKSSPKKEYVPKYDALEPINDKKYDNEVIKMSEEYLAADVTMFAACADEDEGRKSVAVNLSSAIAAFAITDSDDDNDDDRNTSSSEEEEEEEIEEEGFGLPDASLRGGGLFTSTLIELLTKKALLKNKKRKSWLSSSSKKNNNNNDTTTTTHQEFLVDLANELDKRGHIHKPIMTSSRPGIRNQPFTIIHPSSPENNNNLNNNGSSSSESQRKALLIGILYKNQAGELRQSHNDVKAVANYLKTYEGFMDSDIVYLMDIEEDDNDSTSTSTIKQPIRKNIINELKTMVINSKPGDSLFLYFAGHGGQLEDDDGDEDDGYDETILPVDVMKAGPIRDDDLFKLLVPLQKGVTMTAVFDCSHSGTALDLPFTFEVDKPCGPGEFSHMLEVRRMRAEMEKKSTSSDFWTAIEQLNTDEEKIQLLCTQSEDYINADIRLFSGCEDGHVSHDVEDLTGYFYMPEMSSSSTSDAGGAFTASFIEASLNLTSKTSATEDGEDGNGPTTTTATNRSALKRIKDILRRQNFMQDPHFSCSRPMAIEDQFTIVPEHCTGTKRALLIGINYSSHSTGRLNGSHNDVERMLSYLKGVHNFQDENITVLMDNKKSKKLKHTRPIRRNILQAFSKLARSCESGDVVFCHFSGHGGQIEDQDGDEDDGFDETLIPLDVKQYGPIRDDMLFRKFVCQLPKGVFVTCFFDCCNSGTLLDLPFLFTPKDKPIDLINNNLEQKPNFFPHMPYVKSLQEELG